MSKHTHQKLTRTVVITGSTRGIGREMVKGFAQRDWKVAGCARSAGDVEKLSEELGSAHFFKVVDVADDVAVASFARQVLENLGVPDLLINNAALMNDPAPLCPKCCYNPDKQGKHERMKKKISKSAFELKL